jgi:hypothetical protein
MVPAVIEVKRAARTLSVDDRRSFREKACHVALHLDQYFGRVRGPIGHFIDDPER